MPGLVVAFGAIWALTAQALPSDRQRANTSFTLWEAVGHSVMAAMIVAALVGSVITGEWVWACFAFASLLTSIGFISARIRRGEKLSLRDVVDALF
ncbi:hypothetical protein [Leucobacter sp. 1207-22]|uniref:hypothetical protein n=1 Tax=Leucobacter sp. 1207-22 TaxID=2604456 RepID=UPI0040628836